MKVIFTRIKSILAVCLVFAALVLGIVAIPALGAPAAAPAAPDVLTAADAPTTGTVTDCSKYGPGAGTLQDALTANGGGGNITFACDGVIVVPEIVIIQDTVLDGTTHNVTLSGNNANRVLRVAGGSDLTVRNLTIANGNPQGTGAGADNLGGGIYSISGGDLTIENSVFENNKSLRLVGDNLAKASGGAVSYVNTHGALTIRDSAFRNNQTVASGGALNISGYIGNSPIVTITGSTFSNNQAGSVNPNIGGAIAVIDSVEITITNSTLSGNSAYQGGGLALAQTKRSQNMTVRLTHVTLAGNTATQAANFYSSKTSSSSQTFDLANTIVGGGCSVESGVTFNSLGYSLSSDNSCAFLTAATDQQNVDPQLAALADNGGPTQTRALNPGSPAINKIPLVNGSCNDTGVAADQRGYARPEPSGSLCDIGAFEAGAQPPADASLTIVKETVGSGGVFTFTSATLNPSPFTLAAGQMGTFSGAYNVSAAGAGFNCALMPDGNVSCWDFGAASFVVPAGPFIEVDAHTLGACGLRPDGSVDCWGDNTRGASTDQAGPYTTISLGGQHSCGLTPAGAVECWGQNYEGESNPRPGPYVDITTMEDSTCGLTPAGALECWGHRNFSSAGPYTLISGGVQAVCALKPDGSVACWGYGQQTAPENLPAGLFVDVSAADNSACGLRPNGAVECWGGRKLQVSPPAGTFSKRLGTAEYQGMCGITSSGAADCWGYFKFLVDDKPGPFAQSDLSQKTFSYLVPGTYDVTEQIPAGWKLTGLNCDGGNPQISGATVNVTLGQGQHVTCTYTDTYAPTGNIIITKQTAPADPGGTQQFGFTHNIPNYNPFTLGHGGAAVMSNVPAGTYTVTETSAAGGYYLADLTCVETGGQSQANSSGNLATRAATIHLEPGETVRCAYTNALPNAIIVQKITHPANPSGSFDFGFTLTGGVSPITFTLNDQQQETNIVNAGTYTITEDAALFHDLTAVECAVVDSNGNETPVLGDLNTRSVTLTLAAGELAFCRFDNTEQATLTVVKEAFPPDGTPFTFDLFDDTDPGNLLETFVLSDTSATANPDYLITGLSGNAAYIIKEENVAGWADLGIACQLENGDYRFTTNTAPGEYKVLLNPGENVTCTYTNVQEGKINVTKQATPADGTVFNFYINSNSLLPSDNFTLTHGTTKQIVIPFGQYDLGELLPVGWQSDDVQCVVNSGSTSTFDYNAVIDGVRIDLGPDEEVSCTFANSKVPNGTINIVKEATPADDSPFTFTIGQQYYQNFTLTDPSDNTETFTDVPPGGYRVVELQNDSQWELTDINCIESVTQNSAVSVPLRTAEIQVDPGETVTCTFSNQNLTTGTINILKSADPADGTPFDFTSDIPGSTSFNLADDGASNAYFKTILNVPAGSYTVTESVTQGWAVDDVACYDDNGDSLGDPANSRAQIELLGGEEVTCIFYNQQQGSIIIEKQTAPSGGTGFVFTDTIKAPNTFTLDDGQNKTFLNVAPGAYTVTEAAPTGGFLADLSCDDGASAAASTWDLAARTATIHVEKGETVTCTFTNSAYDLIVVQKLTLPAGGTGFGFTTNIPGYPTFTLDDGDLQVMDTKSGNRTITENDPTPAYDLTHLECQVFDPDPAVPPVVVPGDLTTRSVGLQLSPGQAAFCSFVNTKRGSLTVVKKSVGAVDGTFAFTSQTLTPASFSLTTQSGVAQQSFADLQPGSYDVTETVPAGWTLTDLKCKSVRGSKWDRNGGSATLTLKPGDDVTCTFTNTRQGSVTIVKNTLGGDGTFDFTSQTLTPGAFNLTTVGGTAKQVFTGLLPGSYDVAETVPAGWDLTNSTCSDGSNPASISLSAGENVTCTFNNTKLATLTVVKKTVGGDSTFAFTSARLGNFSLTTVGGTAQKAFTDLQPGTYAVSETVPAGWSLTSVTCSDGSIPASISLSAGENVTCTFNNTKLATLTIVKNTAGGDGTFAFTSVKLGNFSLTTVGGTAQKAFTSLAAGSYDVAETVPSGWDLTSATCDNGDTPDQISLTTGQTVTCTFVNEKQDTIIVKKVAVGGDGTFAFSGTLGPFNLTTSNGTANKTFSGLQAGTYSISEAMPAGWDLTSATCDNGDSPANITLTQGETVTCTFTNTKLATLTIVKNTAGGDGTFAFTSSTLTPSSFSLTTVSGTAQQVFAGLLPGSYDVAETVPAGWSLTGATCSDASNPASISLAAGENVTCTFVNTRLLQLFLPYIAKP